MANNNNKITSVTSRLFEFIDRMSDREKLELLKNLEETKIEKERADLRKLCCMEVNCSDENRTYKAFLHDISNSGAFIKTDQVFHLGDKISINIPESGEIEKSVRVGEIKRITKNGIGIQFKRDNKEADKDS